jgi:hypothetical protein
MSNFLAQAAATAGDAALSLVCSAVVVERGKPREGCGLLAADASDLRHADDDGNGRALSNAGNAADKIQPAGEIVMSTQRLDDPCELG